MKYPKFFRKEVYKNLIISTIVDLDSPLAHLLVEVYKNLIISTIVDMRTASSAVLPSIRT